MILIDLLECARSHGNIEVVLKNKGGISEVI